MRKRKQLLDDLEKNVTLDSERNLVTPTLMMEESVPWVESGSLFMPPEAEEENKKLLDIPEVVLAQPENQPVVEFLIISLWMQRALRCP